VNRHFDNDNDLQELRESGGRDREITLGTSTILGIFFVLALLCAVFFGFGYSMGRRSTQTLVNTPETAPIAGSTGYTGSTGSKPAPGSLATPPATASAAHKTTPEVDDTATAAVDSTPTSAATDANVPAPSRPLTANTRYDAATQPPVSTGIKPVSLPRPAIATIAAPAPVAVPGLGSIIVQVAAVSHQEDANLLTDALRKRGYSVAIRQVPQDKLLHIQIGPFATKKDADAMRQRLLADGYNAIVK
jgi:DedD protein